MGAARLVLALVLLLAANVAVALTPNEAAKADFATCLKTSKREKCVKQQELCAANLVRKEKDVKKYEKQLIEKKEKCLAWVIAKTARKETALRFYCSYHGRIWLGHVT